ncbi:leucine-rich repeat-containing protein [Tanacetum coccineum]
MLRKFKDLILMDFQRCSRDQNISCCGRISKLSRRGVLLDSHMCPLCNAAMEDVQHVFFRCDVARVVLRKICRWWDLDWQEICSFSDWDAVVVQEKKLVQDEEDLVQEEEGRDPVMMSWWNTCTVACNCGWCIELPRLPSGELELDTLLSTLTNLTWLDLSYSGISVTTKNANHYVNPNFTDLGLASCKLKVFPNSFRAMKQLHSLDLSNNEIHGQIPHWAGEIGSTYGLYHLNLSHNFIKGLPQFQWYELMGLYLQSNLIEGPFPPSICNIRHLMYLDMSNNHFGGLIPQCFGNFASSLIMINMGHNSFQGTFPSLYDDCSILQGLILKGNQLEGEVPRSWSKCQSLKVVDFGNNHLNGTFPGWLGDLPDLQTLVLKSNNFHGHIQPSSTVESPFPSLRVLDLSYNGFIGQIPAKYFQNFNSMKNVVKISTIPEYLNIDGNYFSFIVAVKGVDQYFPKISVDYTIIDLSNNTFEGQIPNVIGGLNSLIVLNLSHNCLTGLIPHALGNLTEIESLDLSWNQLSGEIPPSLARITTLEVLNLSQNHLVGRIPEGPQFSTFDTSFGGNSGLYGSPLPKREHQSSPKVEDDGGYDDEEDSGFTWKVVTLGYGCGTLVGLVTGYLMLSTRKVKWFNAIADAAQSLLKYFNHHQGRLVVKLPDVLTKGLRLEPFWVNIFSGGHGKDSETVMGIPLLGHVVLDLDETLVRAYETSSMPDSVRKQATDAGLTWFELELFELECVSSYRESDGKPKISYVTVFERPGLHKFLAQLSKFADLVLFTAGLEGYARPLVDRIDAENRFSRRLYRPSTISTEYQEHVKDLSFVSTDFCRMVIVDNNPFSFLLQPVNRILCIPFSADQPRDDQCYLFYGYNMKTALHCQRFVLPLEEVKEQLLEVLLPLLKQLSEQRDVRTFLYERGDSFRLQRLL